MLDYLTVTLNIFYSSHLFVTPFVVGLLLLLLSCYFLKCYFLLFITCPFALVIILKILFLLLCSLLCKVICHSCYCYKYFTICHSYVLVIYYTYSLFHSCYLLSNVIFFYYIHLQ